MSDILLGLSLEEINVKASLTLWMTLLMCLIKPSLARAACETNENPINECVKLASDVKATLSGASIPSSTKNIVDFQAHKTSEILKVANGATIELINLNEELNIWYLVKLTDTNGYTSTYQLQVSDPKAAKGALHLTKEQLELPGSEKSRNACKDFTNAKNKNIFETLQGNFDRANNNSNYFNALCDGHVFLINPRHRPPEEEKTKDKIADIARQSSVGRAIANIAKNSPMGNKPENVQTDATRSALKSETVVTIPSAKVNSDEEPRSVELSKTNIHLALQGDPTSVTLGQWYSSKEHPDVKVSLFSPDMASSEVAKLAPTAFENRSAAHSQNKSLAYLIAFNTQKSKLGYVAGISDATGNCDGGKPAPDGFDDSTPLVQNGMVSPDHQSHLLSTFNAGYLRPDACMRKGPLEGKHWGFVQNGVVFSKLQPGLATLVTYKDGKTDILEWPENAAALATKVKDARQNATPVISGRDPKTGLGIPGNTVGGKDFISRNWTNDVDDKRMRSGACMLQSGTDEHLVFAYLPSGTVKDLAEVFGSYGCRSGMQLDENIERSGDVSLITHNASGEMENKECLHKHCLKDRIEKEITGVTKGSRRDFFYIEER